MDNIIQYIDQRLAQLRAMIPIYKGQHSLENLLASEIIYLEIKRIEHLQSFNANFTPIFNIRQIPCLVF